MITYRTNDIFNITISQWDAHNDNDLYICMRTVFIFLFLYVYMVLHYLALMYYALILLCQEWRNKDVQSIIIMSMKPEAGRVWGVGCESVTPPTPPPPPPHKPPPPQRPLTTNTPSPPPHHHQHHSQSSSPTSHHNISIWRCTKAHIGSQMSS